MPHRKVGPDQPEVRDGLVGENVFPVGSDIGELASRHSGVPPHRRPGAQKKATPANSTDRTNPAVTD
jgi:hypothetical protein